LTFLVPLLVRQLRSFVLITPAIANNTNDFLVGLIEPPARSDLLPVSAEQATASLVQDLFNRARDIIEGLLGGLVGFISGALNFGIVVFGMLFVAAYLLAEVRKVKATFLKAAPMRYGRDALDLWEAFGVSLSRYLGGLLFVVVIQGVLAGLALWILGVPYAILLGAWVSLTAIIPYLGAFLGGMPAVLVALIFKSPTVAVLTAVAYVLIQQLEGNSLTPHPGPSPASAPDHRTLGRDRRRTAQGARRRDPRRADPRRPPRLLPLLPGPHPDEAGANGLGQDENRPERSEGLDPHVRTTTPLRRL
jgi:predicted PurR-regulated permease PerM